MNKEDRRYKVRTIDGKSKDMSHAKASRSLEHADWNRERRDRGCLEDLNVGEMFTDCGGDRWERLV